MKLYKIYLSDSLEGLVNAELLAESLSIQNVIKLAYQELAARNIKTEPYCRFLGMPDGIAIDFGSWSQFLIIANATLDEISRA